MKQPSSPVVALVAGSALVLAVAGTIAFGVGGGPADPRGNSVSGSPTDFAARMEEAHSVAGVSTSSLTAVQGSFHSRVEEAKNRLAQTPKDRGLLLEVARLLHDGHRPAEAAEYYLQAIDLDPGEPQAYYDLAQAHADQGSWSEAAAVLRSRLQVEPDDDTALYDLGAVLANAGDVAGARASWEQLASTTDDASVRRRAEAGLGQIGSLGTP